MEESSTDDLLTNIQNEKTGADKQEQPLQQKSILASLQTELLPPMSCAFGGSRLSCHSSVDGKVNPCEM